MGKDDEVRTDHEAMRLLILSRFEHDALVREEVEVWLDEVAAPGEPVSCDCAELGLCYCFCKKCETCGKVQEAGDGGEDESGEESVEIEVVPGMKILATFGIGRNGKNR